jgi:hypothetical protein
MAGVVVDAAGAQRSFAFPASAAALAAVLALAGVRFLRRAQAGAGGAG